MNRHGTAVVTLPSDTDINITRVFDASAEKVFAAWTTPEHVRRWWGSDEAPLTVCDIDLRVGGNWRYAMDMNNTEFAWHGTYQDIVAPTRLVSTEVFEGYPDGEALNTLTLTETEGVTTLIVIIHHATKENRDGHIASGMEPGMQRTLNALEDLLTAKHSNLEERAGLDALSDALQQNGQYRARVPVADDADDQTRLIAATGRHP